MVGLRGIYGPVGGIEAALSALVPRLADRGFEMVVCCRDRYQTLPGHLRPGVRLVSMPTIYTKHLETILYTLLSQLRIGGADVVHFHALGPTLVSPIPRALGFKVVSTIHGLDWQRPRWGTLASSALHAGEWISANVPHETVVVSRALQNHYASRYPRPTRYIPNGVDLLPHRPLQRLRRLGLEPGRYFLFLGRLVPDKGCELLLEAFRRLPTSHRLLMAGAAPQEDGYTAKLRRMAAEDPRVILPGPLHGPEKEEALSNAAAFVLPSRTEGLAVALLEAMAQARCPIVSDIDANLEAVGATEPGGPAALVFRTGSADALREALAKVLDAPDLALELGLRAFERVRRCYSWDAAADQLEALYRALR
jgi:glycosyltransferase involved in cell wall biosynthesis